MTTATERLTMADRVAAYNLTVGAKWPASELLYNVAEHGRSVAYGIWLIGAFFANETDFYGAHPRTYLTRVLALFPDAGDRVLHACSGSMPPGPYEIGRAHV